MNRLEKHLDYHLFIHSLFFILVTILVFIWTTSPKTTYYNLQLAIIFLVGYFLMVRLTHRLKKLNHAKYQPIFEKHYQLLINTSLIGGLILLLVSSTGGVGSAWFFLIYFYLFSVSLLLEKEVVGIYTFVIFLFFSLLPLEISLNVYLIRLLSLLLIAPLAYYLGYKYEEVKKLRQKIKQTAKGESKIEEETLLGLDLKIKPLILGSLDKLSLLLPEVNRRQKETLGQAIKEIKTAFKEVEVLIKNVDEVGDKINQKKKS